MSPDTERPLSKGRAMIASYRAQRLQQRPLLRATLRTTYAALRLERISPHVGIDDTAKSLIDVSKSDDRSSLTVEVAVSENSIFSSLINLADFANEPDLEVGMPAETPIPALIDSLTIVTELREAEEQGNASDRDGRGAALTSMSSNDEEVPLQSSTSISHDPPLARIGFGPGMVIRLSQLGLNTIADLAMVNATDLRAALGEISRLVDVEMWIESARLMSHRKSSIVE